MTESAPETHVTDANVLQNAKKPHSSLGPPDLDPEQLHQVCQIQVYKDAEDAQVIWARVKGYPWWPAQVLSQKAAKSRLGNAKARKDHEPVIFFGTLEVGWVAHKDLRKWADGISTSLHTKVKHNRKFQSALDQVGKFLAVGVKRKAPTHWWCKPPVVKDCTQSGQQPGSETEEGTSIKGRELSKRNAQPAEAASDSDSDVDDAGDYSSEDDAVSDSNPQDSSSGEADSEEEDANISEAAAKSMSRRVSRSDSRQKSAPAHMCQRRTVEAHSDAIVEPVEQDDGSKRRTRRQADTQLLPASNPGDSVIEEKLSSGRASFILKLFKVEPQMPEEAQDFVLPKDVMINRATLYETVKRNVWVSRPRPKRLPKDEVNVCNCKVKTVHPEDGSVRKIGCHMNCLNRLSSIHCDVRSCPCGEYCSNTPFWRLEQPQVEVFMTENRGFGVKASQVIPKGSFIVEYAGEVIDEPELRVRMDQARQANEPHFYIMGLHHGLYIDARRKGNLARLLNSSCAPNCETQKWHDAGTAEVRVGIFASRDIQPGEELTYDYQFKHYGPLQSAMAFRCRCGAPNCKGTMDANPERRKDYGRRIEVWWDGDGVYYRGTVIDYSTASRKHVVVYDDGDSEKLCLDTVPHRWLEADASPKATGRAPSPMPANGLRKSLAAEAAAGREATPDAQDMRTKPARIRGMPAGRVRRSSQGRAGATSGLTTVDMEAAGGPAAAEEQQSPPKRLKTEAPTSPTALRSNASGGLERTNSYNLVPPEQYMLTPPILEDSSPSNSTPLPGLGLALAPELGPFGAALAAKQELASEDSSSEEADDQEEDPSADEVAPGADSESPEAAGASLASANGEAGEILARIASPVHDRKPPPSGRDQSPIHVPRKGFRVSVLPGDPSRPHMRVTRNLASSMGGAPPDVQQPSPLAGVVAAAVPSLPGWTPPRTRSRQSPFQTSGSSPFTGATDRGTDTPIMRKRKSETGVQLLGDGSGDGSAAASVAGPPLGADLAAHIVIPIVPCSSPPRAASAPQGAAAAVCSPGACDPEDGEDVGTLTGEGQVAAVREAAGAGETQLPVTSLGQRGVEDMGVVAGDAVQSRSVRDLDGGTAASKPASPAVAMVIDSEYEGDKAEECEGGVQRVLVAHVGEQTVKVGGTGQGLGQGSGQGGAVEQSELVGEKAALAQCRESEFDGGVGELAVDSLIPADGLVSPQRMESYGEADWPCDRSQSQQASAASLAVEQLAGSMSRSPSMRCVATAGQPSPVTLHAAMLAAGRALDSYGRRMAESGMPPSAAAGMAQRPHSPLPDCPVIEPLTGRASADPGLLAARTRKDAPREVDVDVAPASPGEGEALLGKEEGITVAVEEGAQLQADVEKGAELRPTIVPAASSKGQAVVEESSVSPLDSGHAAEPLVPNSMASSMALGLALGLAMSRGPASPPSEAVVADLLSSLGQQLGPLRDLGVGPWPAQLVQSVRHMSGNGLLPEAQGLQGKNGSSAAAAAAATAAAAAALAAVQGAAVGPLAAALVNDANATGGNASGGAGATATAKPVPSSPAHATPDSSTSVPASVKDLPVKQEAAGDDNQAEAGNRQDAAASTAEGGAEEGRQCGVNKGAVDSNGGERFEGAGAQAAEVKGIWCHDGVGANGSAGKRMRQPPKRWQEGGEQWLGLKQEHAEVVEAEFATIAGSLDGWRQRYSRTAAGKVAFGGGAIGVRDRKRVRDGMYDEVYDEEEQDDGEDGMAAAEARAAAEEAEEAAVAAAADAELAEELAAAEAVASLAVLATEAVAQLSAEEELRSCAEPSHRRRSRPRATDHYRICPPASPSDFLSPYTYSHGYPPAHPQHPGRSSPSSLLPHVGVAPVRGLRSVRMRRLSLPRSSMFLPNWAEAAAAVAAAASHGYGHGQGQGHPQGYGYGQGNATGVHGHRVSRGTAGVAVTPGDSNTRGGSSLRRRMSSPEVRSAPPALHSTADSVHQHGGRERVQRRRLLPAMAGAVSPPLPDSDSAQAREAARKQPRNRRRCSGGQDCSHGHGQTCAGSPGHGGPFGPAIVKPGGADAAGHGPQAGPRRKSRSHSQGNGFQGRSPCPSPPPPLSHSRAAWLQQHGHGQPSHGSLALAASVDHGGHYLGHGYGHGHGHGHAPELRDAAGMVGAVKSARSGTPQSVGAASSDSEHLAHSTSRPNSGRQASGVVVVYGGDSLRAAIAEVAAGAGASARPAKTEEVGAMVKPRAPLGQSDAHAASNGGLSNGADKDPPGTIRPQLRTSRGSSGGGIGAAAAHLPPGGGWDNAIWSAGVAHRGGRGWGTQGSVSIVAGGGGLSRPFGNGARANVSSANQAVAATAAAAAKTVAELPAAQLTVRITPPGAQGSNSGIASRPATQADTPLVTPLGASSAPRAVPTARGVGGDGSGGGSASNGSSPVGTALLGPPSRQSSPRWAMGPQAQQAQLHSLAQQALLLQQQRCACISPSISAPGATRVTLPQQSSGSGSGVAGLRCSSPRLVPPGGDALQCSSSPPIHSHMVGQGTIYQARPSAPAAAGATPTGTSTVIVAGHQAVLRHGDRMAPVGGFGSGSTAAASAVKPIASALAFLPRAGSAGPAGVLGMGGLGGRHGKVWPQDLGLADGNGLGMSQPPRIVGMPAAVQLAHRLMDSAAAVVLRATPPAMGRPPLDGNGGNGGHGNSSSHGNGSGGTAAVIANGGAAVAPPPLADGSNSGVTAAQTTGPGTGSGQHVDTTNLESARGTAPSVGVDHGDQAGAVAEKGEPLVPVADACTAEVAEQRQVSSGGPAQSGYGWLFSTSLPADKVAATTTPPLFRD